MSKTCFNILVTFEVDIVMKHEAPIEKLPSFVEQQ